LRQARKACVYPIPHDFGPAVKSLAWTEIYYCPARSVPGSPLVFLRGKTLKTYVASYIGNEPRQYSMRRRDPSTRKIQRIAGACAAWAEGVISGAAATSTVVVATAENSRRERRDVVSPAEPPAATVLGAS
jgi:hypothetical protein